MKKIVFLVASLSLLFACQSNRSKNENTNLRQASQEEVDKVVEAFVMAENGSVITIPEGFFSFSTQLIIDNKHNIVIRGQGQEKTTLSFKNLKAGGEGIKLVGNNIIIENIRVEDAPGDGIKAQKCDTITFKNVFVTWTQDDERLSGTYAIYPVECKHVLIEQCTASRSRDAGIYVGQSEKVIVKNSTAFANVAGIEIENCDDAEVVNCKATDNAGGILVFNLPGLNKSDGSRTKIHHNEVIENNHKNFAADSTNGNGNTVSLIPPGSGIILLAAKNVDVYENKILRNKTLGIAIASYQITGFPVKGFTNWSPYSNSIFIHHNTYERPWSIPDMSKDLGKLINVYNAHGVGKPQDIVYDGIWDTSLTKDVNTNPHKLCIEEKNADLRFTLFYLMEGEDKIKSYKEMKPFSCTLSNNTF